MSPRYSSRPPGKDQRIWLLTMLIPGAYPCVLALGGLILQEQAGPLTDSDRFLLTAIAAGLVVLVPLWLWAAASSVRAASAARRAALDVGG